MNLTTVSSEALKPLLSYIIEITKTLTQTSDRASLVLKAGGSLSVRHFVVSVQR